jgi:hypothetical protein
LMTKAQARREKSNCAVIKLQAKRLRETRIAMLPRGETWLISA